MSKNPDLRPVIFVVGMEEAEDAVDYLREGGWDAHSIVPDISPNDYHKWEVSGRRTFIIEMAEVLKDFRGALSNQLKRGGAEWVHVVTEPEAMAVGILP